MFCGCLVFFFQVCRTKLLNGFTETGSEMGQGRIRGLGLNTDKQTDPGILIYGEEDKNAHYHYTRVGIIFYNMKRVIL